MDEVISYWGKDSSWFWSMCQFVVIAITLIMIYMQVRIQRKSNMIKTIHRHIDKWQSDSLIKCRSHAARHFNDNVIHVHEEEVIIINFFEDIGIYYDEKILSKDIIWNTFSYYIERYWPLLKAAIRERRKIDNDDSLGQHFEHLYHVMQNCSKKNGAPTGDFARAELNNFAKHEENLVDSNTLNEGAVN